MNNIYLYLIPLYYTYHSRCKDTFLKISYIFSFIFPIFILNFEIMGEINNLLRIILVLFSILSVMSIYEIGYIVNDTLTIKKEKNPTLRLCETERQVLEEKIKKIIFLKILVAAILFKVMNFELEVEWIKYILMSFVILWIYYLHNNIRNKKINFITFMSLSFCRFFWPIYLINESINYMVMVSIFLELVLIRNIELIGKKYKFYRFNIYQKRDSFRVVYYLFLLLVYTILRVDLQFKILLYYLLVYRFLGYLFVKLKNIKKRL